MPRLIELGLQHSCATCAFGKSGRVCDLSPDSITALEEMKFTSGYPKGATLFVEGEAPRGVFILCSGGAKLTTSSAQGKTLIVKMGEPGEIFGVSDVILGKPYEVSAEITEPSQVNFVRRDDFLQFLQLHPDAAMRTAQQLAGAYHAAQRGIRTFGLSQTTSEKLARLLLNWCEKGEQTTKGVRLKVLLTHEEIAQMIGTTRETVTRLLGDFKRRQIIDVKGSTFLIPQRAGLLGMTTF